MLMDSDSMAIQTGSSLGSPIGTVTKMDTKCIDGSFRPQGRIHYHATNFLANPPTSTSGTKLAALARSLCKSDF
ncbi:hypothetical protein V6N13_001497 [Hibiscus sabdariffa]